MMHDFSKLNNEKMAEEKSHIKIPVSPGLQAPRQIELIFEWNTCLFEFNNCDVFFTRMIITPFRFNKGNASFFILLHFV